MRPNNLYFIAIGVLVLLATAIIILMWHDSGDPAGLVLMDILAFIGGVLFYKGWKK